MAPNEYLNNEEATVVDWRKRRRLLKNYQCYKTFYGLNLRIFVKS
jgi:hypothetical protein